MLEVLHEDYMRTARAKGLNLRQTLARHGLRNALIPVITIMGLQFSFLLAGTVIIENVFSLPGLGRLVFQAINQRDLITVKAVIMLLVATVILVNFPRGHHLWTDRSAPSSQAGWPMTKPHLFSTDAHKYRSFLGKGMHSPSFVIGSVITLFFVALALCLFCLDTSRCALGQYRRASQAHQRHLLAWNGSLWP